MLSPGNLQGPFKNCKSSDHWQDPSIHLPRLLLHCCMTLLGQVQSILMQPQPLEIPLVNKHGPLSPSALAGTYMLHQFLHKSCRERQHNVFYGPDLVYRKRWDFAFH